MRSYNLLQELIVALDGGAAALWAYTIPAAWALLCAAGGIALVWLVASRLAVNIAVESTEAGGGNARPHPVGLAQAAWLVLCAASAGILLPIGAPMNVTGIGAASVILLAASGAVFFVAGGARSAVSPGAVAALGVFVASALAVVFADLGFGSGKAVMVGQTSVGVAYWGLLRSPLTFGAGLFSAWAFAVFFRTRGVTPARGDAGSTYRWTHAGAMYLACTAWCLLFAGADRLPAILIPESLLVDHPLPMFFVSALIVAGKSAAFAAILIGAGRFAHIGDPRYFQALMLRRFTPAMLVLAAGQIVWSML